MRYRTVVPALLAIVAFASCALSESTTQPTGTPAGLPPEQLDFARKPISYFNANCANCHGEYGGYWGEGFVSAHTPQELREAVEGMCNGPAQAPIQGRALESQTAYNASLRDKTPFATAYAGEGGTLRGEVTPGASVTLVSADGAETPATVEGHAWTSNLASAGLVRVEKDGRRVEVKVPQEGGVAFAQDRPATRP